MADEFEDYEMEVWNKPYSGYDTLSFELKGEHDNLLRYKQITLEDRSRVNRGCWSEGNCLVG